MRTPGWTASQLEKAVKDSRSVRQVILKLGLKAAGGNYRHVQKTIDRLRLDRSHFTGMGWNIGLQFVPKPPLPLAEILLKDTDFQSYKLKLRLFNSGLKKAEWELRGWKKQAAGGRIPVELDHINGSKFDNRIENLRILCPNCHSLQPTHRGLNKVK